MAQETWTEKARRSEFILEDNGNLVVKNAVTRFRNFSGEANTFGSTQRVFNVIVTPEVAAELVEIGWRVKTRTEQDGDITNMIEVVVNMDSQWPPIVNLYTEFRGKKTCTPMTKDDIGDLDRKIRIKKCDVVIHPRNTTMKGYLRELRVVEEPQNGYFGDEYAEYETVNHDPLCDSADETEIPFE